VTAFHSFFLFFDLFVSSKGYLERLTAIQILIAVVCY
jgi:hypothetical protein